MQMLSIRKTIVQVEEIRRDAGKDIHPPTQKAVAAAVIENPFADRYVENLEPLYDLGAEISGMLAEDVRGDSFRG